MVERFTPMWDGHLHQITLESHEVEPEPLEAQRASSVRTVQGRGEYKEEQRNPEIAGYAGSRASLKEIGITSCVRVKKAGRRFILC